LDCVADHREFARSPPAASTFIALSALLDSDLRLMVILGILAASNFAGTRIRAARFPFDPRTCYIIPLAAMVVFAAFGLRFS
jgi:hypothetical protein